jgi:hypothetical protein
MPYEYTTTGLDYIVNGVFQKPDSRINTIAVGSGTTAPSVTDSSLESRVFEATDETSAVSFESGSDPGEYISRIAVQGGTEVPGGVGISELGIKTDNGDLVYRETRNTVTVETGSRIVFEFSVDISNI